MTAGLQCENGGGDVSSATHGSVNFIGLGMFKARRLLGSFQFFLIVA